MKPNQITFQTKSATILIPKTDLQRSIRQNQIHINPQYYQELYQERAGILQYDGGCSKEEAEIMSREPDISERFI